MRRSPSPAPRERVASAARRVRVWPALAPLARERAGVRVRGCCSGSEMLGQIVEPDFVLLAPPAPGDELAGRGAQRLRGVQDVGSGAGLVVHYGVDLWVVTVELGKFRRDVAGGEDGAGAERVL